MTEGATAIKTQPHPAERKVHSACGPAMLVGVDGRLYASNEAAASLASAWDARDAELRGLILSAAAAGGPISGRLVLAAPDSAENRQAFEIAAVPMGEAEVLVIGRDASFEDNLTRALLRSRDLYKDLMACSADFGWETDSQGRFVYVSPAGALGFESSMLNGAEAASVFGLSDEAADAAFATRSPQSGREIEARDAEGRRVRLSVASRPVVDEEGYWCGARGIARDITQDREREATLRLDQARNALLARIVLAIRTEAEAAEIVEVAAQAAAEALRAEMAWALRKEAPAGESKEPPSLLAGEAGLQTLAERALARAGEERGNDASVDAYVELGFEGSDVLVAAAGNRQAAQCAIVFARETEHEPWRAHEVELVHGIADHMAVALKQAAMLARLERLSRTDELSGLLNRRALFEDVAKRIGHQRRSGRPACFLFLDLDHFKTVNDTLGHKAGDAVIAALGSLLRDHLRVGDLVGRIGGDEFALWLEDTAVEGARAKAELLMAEIPALRQAAGDPDTPLSMSIGIAESDPETPRSPDILTDAADRALYAAKRQGRSRIALANFSEDNAA